ncbi:hypothetical protein AB0D84_27155 [Streptomyces sp. NPDC048193]
MMSHTRPPARRVTRVKAALMLAGLCALTCLALTASLGRLPV